MADMCASGMVLCSADNLCVYCDRRRLRSALEDIRDADAEMMAPVFRSYVRMTIARALKGGE